MTQDGRPILNYCELFLHAYTLSPPILFLHSSLTSFCESHADSSATARAVYTYAAAIPEELSFSKNDVLAVLRMQDDGWWEAELPKTLQRGLVPSNYLGPT